MAQRSLKLQITRDECACGFSRRNRKAWGRCWHSNAWIIL